MINLMPRYKQNIPSSQQARSRLSTRSLWAHVRVSSQWVHSSHWPRPVSWPNTSHTIASSLQLPGAGDIWPSIRQGWRNIVIHYIGTTWPDPLYLILSQDASSPVVHKQVSHTQWKSQHNLSYKNKPCDEVSVAAQLIKRVKACKEEKGV